MTKKVELLAPAGDWQALKAAVENGADAVYIGGKEYSARNFAENFNLDEIEKALEYCHIKEVKIYAAVNILIKNQEIDDILDYIFKLQNIGIDGIIIQDIGLLFLLRNIFPNLDIHCSTQMTIHNAEGVEFLAKNGAKRVILSREISLRDIKDIKNISKIGLEVFIHGALCFSYSGQCLMSSMIGRRSGNRGKCSQPCRMEYNLVDLNDNKILDILQGNFPLSLKDLCSAKTLNYLMDNNLGTFKIEGRMKSADYVAVVTNVYRRLIDRYYDNPNDYYVLENELKNLKQIFNRGFTNLYIADEYKEDSVISFSKPNNRGLFLGRVKNIDSKGFVSVLLKVDLTEGDHVEFWVTKGGRRKVIIEEIIVNDSVVKKAKKDEQVNIKVSFYKHIQQGDRIFKIFDSKLVKSVRENYKDKSLIPIKMKVTTSIGKPLLLNVYSDKGEEVTVETTLVTKRAHTSPLTYEILNKHLGKLGGTFFKLIQLDYYFEEDKVMIPVSELNKVRRKAVQKLKEKLLSSYKQETITRPAFIKNKNKAFKYLFSEKQEKIKIAVHVGDYNSFEEALKSKADYIYVAADSLRSKLFDKNYLNKVITNFSDENKKIVISLPRFLFYDDKKEVNKLLNVIKAYRPYGVMVGNLGILQKVKEALPDINIIGDYWLNCCNDFSVYYYYREGLKRITLSLELTIQEIRKMTKPLAFECIVHGSIPLISSHHCIFKYSAGCMGDYERDTKNFCSKGSLGLEDKAGYVFPIDMDRRCRMFVYNANELCMIRELAKIKSAGIETLRLELQRENYSKIRMLVDSYYDAVHGLEESKKAEKILEMYSDITTGHYFRGVD